jgi:hypothetical protein
MRVYLKKSDRRTLLTVYLSPAKLKGRCVLVQGNSHGLVRNACSYLVRLTSAFHIAARMV